MPWFFSTGSNTARSNRRLEGRSWALIATVSLAALGGCGEAEPTAVPVGAVPLGEAGGQCVDVFKETFADASSKLCLYFEGAPCVLVADLSDASTEGCAGTGDCSLEQGQWTKFCPEGSPAFDLETEAGQTVPATVFIVAEGMAGERPSYCTFAPPTEACDGSTDPQQTGNRCLARIDLSYIVDEVDGSLNPDPNAQPKLTYSGFVQEEMGLWQSTDPVCPSIAGGGCPPEAPSCTSVDLELLIEGSSAGQVRTVPRGEVCTDARCRNSYPRGRMISISATANPGAVLTAFEAALGAEEGCNELFVETTTTATCTITLTGSGQVTTKFGYELAVGVNGLGQVTGSPGGIDGDGIDCGGNQTCREVYDSEANVTLSATQTETDWKFSQWMGGPCDGDGSPNCTVQMNQAHVVTALFGYALSLEVQGDGSITAQPPGVACTGTDSPCVVTYGSGDSVTLTVSPSQASVFSGWGGDCASEGTSLTCSLTMDQERSVLARFAYEIGSRVEGGGTVTRTPPGAACASLPANLCGAYEGSSNVAFNTAPSANWVFLDWVGCSSAPGVGQCSISVTQSALVRARFGRQLDFTIAGGGSVDITVPAHGTCAANNAGDCNGVYADGSVVMLTARPDTGWAVSAAGWTGCTPVSGSPERCTVTMNAAKQVSFGFGRAMDVSTTGSGTVVSAPTGISCGADCDEVFADGQTVTLNAAPAGGAAFESWQGCTPNPQNARQCTVNMSGPVSVTANFGQGLTVAVVGVGVVQSTPAGVACSDAGGSCTQTFVDGTTVTLDANPQAGWAFHSWQGCTPNVAIPSRCTVVLSQARNVTATFGRQMTVSTTGQGNVLLVGGTGIGCPGDCDEVFLDGQQVTLRANAVGGWALVGFTGCDSISGIECSVTMNQARSVGTTFGRALVVTVAGNIGGRVSSTPAGINCTSSGVGCSQAYSNGQVVTLDATPNTGFTFLGWSGCTPVGGNPTRCTTTMSAARNVTSTFGRQLSVATSGNGVVTSVPGGINCGADCDEVYTNGTPVVLTATPGGGEAFGGWSGCPSPSGNVCTVPMTAARSVTAGFGTDFTVVIAAGQGTVSSLPAGINCPGDCSQVFNSGENIRLTATPATGYVVQSWAGCTQDGSNPNLCTVNASGGGQTVTVRFGRALTVSVTGAGTVTSAPPGINCGVDCDETYANNTQVTLTATPNAGSAFLLWSGCTPVNGVPQQCTTTMSAVRSVTASFGRQLTVNLTGQGTVTSNPLGINCGTDCDQVYANNTVVTLDATPANGWVFLSWTACTPVGGTPQQCTAAMGGARSVTANFGRQLNINIVGNGSTSSNPNGVSCGAGCEVHPDGTIVILVATPNAGRTLRSWTGCIQQANPLQCRLTLNALSTVTVEFGRQMNLTVTGPGTVTSNPAGINCGADCTEVFGEGDAVTLTAVPTAGYEVTWVGCTPAGNVCTTTMNQARTISASFLPTLTVSAPTSEAGEVISSDPGGINCSGVACTDTAAFANPNVRLTAAPNANRVVEWTGCTVVIGNDNQCDVTVNAPRTVGVVYRDTFLLTLTMTSTTGGTGTVNLTPGDINGVNACTVNCNVRYVDGTAVTVAATPDAGSQFREFSNNCTGTTCAVTMDQVRAVGTNFTAN